MTANNDPILRSEPGSKRLEADSASSVRETRSMSGFYLRTLSSAACRRVAPILDLRVWKTQMKPMNNLLRAYGGIDVASSAFSVFTEMTVKNGTIDST